VKQICHGNSSSISRDLLQTAMAYCSDRADVRVLLGSIFDTVDSFASHSAVVYRCLALVRAGLDTGSSTFRSIACSFAPDIRLITCLTFEGPKCSLRSEIHAMAFALYHNLVHEQTFTATRPKEPPPAPMPNRALAASLPLPPSPIEMIGSESESVNEIWGKAPSSTSDGVNPQPEAIVFPPPIPKGEAVQKIEPRAITHEDLRALFRGLPISDPFENFVVPEFPIELRLQPPIVVHAHRRVKSTDGVRNVSNRMQAIVPQPQPPVLNDPETFDPFEGMHPSG
jgi:hypothetical protein